MTDNTIDPNNFTRVTLALERWIKTGEILAACLEKSGDTYRKVTLTGPADFTFEGQTAL